MTKILKGSPRAEDVELGRRFRAQRMLAGRSQSAVAEAIGVTFQQVQKYEKGVNRFPISRLRDAAVFIGCRMQDLVEGYDAANDGSEANDPVVMAFARRLNRMPTDIRGRTLQALSRTVDAIEQARA